MYAKSIPEVVCKVQETILPYAKFFFVFGTRHMDKALMSGYCKGWRSKGAFYGK